MSDAERILDGLNPQQREAAETVRGPVIILAGAGSGKTTTITRRIAYQVATDTFTAGSILAVAFTVKAKTEMRQRLERLGVSGVNVQTIHGAAYQQLGWGGRPVPDVLGEGDKQRLMQQAVERVAPQHRYVYRKDLIDVIERAKGSGILPSDFATKAASWTMPLDPSTVGRIYVEYERRKALTGKIDFEDMQWLALDAFSDPAHAARVRQRIHAVTVDEFQDVNAVQVRLVEAWLGGRDEICVVGDDYQSIFGFRGGSPGFLLDWTRRFPNARRVRLEENYRSTPEVLGFANRLVPSLGGERKVLRPTRPGGPEPVLRQVSAEPAFVVETARRLNGDGIAYEEMALLVRINRSTAPFEEGLAAARIPYRVEEGSFLQRPAVAAAVRLLRQAEGPVMREVEKAAALGGLRPDPTASGEHIEDLKQFVAIAAEFAEAHAGATAAEFVRDIEARFAPQEDLAAGRGIRLMTYHKAKGMEFEVVFLPMLRDGEMPYRSSKAMAPLAEERRLLYVGITRAKRHLFVTRSGAASVFWHELLPPRPKSLAGPPPARAARPIEVLDLSGSLLDVLRRWRERLHRRPQFSLFNDQELAKIAQGRPRDMAELTALLHPRTKSEANMKELVDLIQQKVARDAAQGEVHA